MNHQLDTATADAIYQILIDMHAGLDDAASAKLNARMILVLANHIGDPAIIAQAAAIAKTAATDPGGEAT